MKLDGDIELPPNYFERMLEEYARDPKLGMAAGNLIEPGRGGRMIPMPIARHHIHGALKLYTRECFEAIGGVPTRLGWDTIDETYARLRGFTTRNWDDVIGIHHRPHASADGTLRGRARHGECAYIAHFSPLWVALRSVKIMRDRPMIISGFAFFYGYVRSAVRRVEQRAGPGVPHLRPLGAAHAAAHRGLRRRSAAARPDAWISAGTCASCSRSTARWWSAS